MTADAANATAEVRRSFNGDYSPLYQLAYMMGGRAAEEMVFHGPTTGAGDTEYVVDVTGLTAPGVIDGAMDGDSFLAYVEQSLVPTLTPGDIVIRDGTPPASAPAPAGHFLDRAL